MSVFIICLWWSRPSHSIRVIIILESPSFLLGKTMQALRWSVWPVVPGLRQLSYSSCHSLLHSTLCSISATRVSVDSCGYVSMLWIAKDSLRIWKKKNQLRKMWHRKKKKNMEIKWRRTVERHMIHVLTSWGGDVYVLVDVLTTGLETFGDILYVD